VLVEDGDILQLAPGKVEVVDSAPIGRLAVDGSRLVPLNGGILAARRRMLFNGIVVASVAVDSTGRLLGTPLLSAPGLLEADDPEAGRVIDQFSAALADLPAPLRREDAAFTEAARAALRRALGRRLQKRPMVDVHVMRVPG
jgi:ribonuclease J